MDKEFYNDLYASIVEAGAEEGFGNVEEGFANNIYLNVFVDGKDVGVKVDFCVEEKPFSYGAYEISYIDQVDVDYIFDEMGDNIKDQFDYKDFWSFNYDRRYIH